MERVINVSLLYRANFPESLDGAAVRDLVVEHYEALCALWDADILVTVSGE